LKLYELAENYRQLQELMEELDNETLQDTLESIEDAIEEKIKNIVYLIKNIEADINMFKEEEKRLSTRRKTLENKLENLKNYLETQMRIANLNKIKAGTFNVSFRKTPPKVTVINEEKIPQEYWIPQQPKLDKDGLKKALKNGQTIEGVELTQEEKLNIR
jgi:predicted nuclease with TOPRIM domain